MRTLKFLFVVVLAATLSIGCNDKKAEKTVKEATETVKENVTEAAESAKDAVKEAVEEIQEAVSGDVSKVTIAGNDKMQYDLKTITVKAGQKVELTLNHIGKMSKQTMGHNWVLVKPDTDLGKFGVAAASAADTDYIPAEYEDQVIAHTKMLGGGESDSITFDAPAPGTYTFLCSFPGHNVLMRGEFIVE